MGPTKLIIHMTGLLLLAPQAPGTFPLHVLMPTEGQSGQPLHVAQLGWRSIQSECPNTTGYTFEPGGMFGKGICYFKIDGLSVALGEGGTPTSSILPPVGPFDVSYLHRVNPTWFGAMPGGQIRSRVSIYSGRALEGCPYASWTIGSTPGVNLPNVITWETTIPGPLLALTGTKLNQIGTPATVTIKPTPFTTSTIELFVRQEPEITPTTYPKPWIANHFHAFYDLLGYQSGEPRIIPYNGAATGLGCNKSQKLLLALPAPGTPTCMPVVGSPP